MYPPTKSCHVDLDIFHDCFFVRKKYFFVKPFYSKCVTLVVGAFDAGHQAGIQDHQTVGGHWVPGRRPQDGLQRNGLTGADQPRVSSNGH